uniref:DDE Tnp4 domain-containing protein n=1 Tax=Cyprinus carpio TaxID=7962 RepID=A0A8C1P3K6_CYPCA
MLNNKTKTILSNSQKSFTVQIPAFSISAFRRCIFICTFFLLQLGKQDLFFTQFNFYFCSFGFPFQKQLIAVTILCLIALRFYACGTFYQVIGDNMGVRKATVSNVVKAMSVALGSLINQFTKHQFFQMGNMPSTIGAIDCTHVHIQAPCEREWEYVNRKGRHSINIQLVGNADLIITNCVVKWPGSVHDPRILRESALYRELQSHRPNGIVLGDSAYPLLPWLMTPFPVANTPDQARFNSSHCKTRCAIERLNGVLKRRFACLNYLRVQPKVACNIILACIVLHNIATRRHVPLDDNFDGPEPDVEPEQPPMFFPNEGHPGHAIRDAIVRNYF